MNETPEQALLAEKRWDIVRKLMAWHHAGKKLNTRKLRDGPLALASACKRYFGSCRQAIKAAGLTYEGHRGRQFWTAQSTIERLRQLDQRRADLSWTGLAKGDYSLAQASIRYFGTYARALQKAGVDYDRHIRRRTTQWNDVRVIKTLQGIHASGGDLSMTAMMRGQSQVVRPAIKRFGSYANALKAAGIDYDGIRRIRTWSEKEILELISKEHQAGRSLAVSAVDKRLPGFRVAASRHFGSYEKAVKAAGIDYEKVRKLKSWTRATLIRGLRELAARRQDLRYSVMAREHGPLAYSCVARFGSYAAAMRAAGILHDNGLRLLSAKQVLSLILADDKAGRDIRIRQMRARHRGLESASRKHFGSYGAAVMAAGLDYPPPKPLAYWTKPRVLKTLLKLKREGVDMRYAAFKVSHQSLFAAARHYYGKYHLAVEAAGIDYSNMLREANARSR